jgi:hypothetical protein
MTKRYTEIPNPYYVDGNPEMCEDPEGEFVHYSDYAKLVVTLREAILDLDRWGEHPAYKRRMEKALVDLGEDI